MAAQRAVMVVDMQNGVFATPRIERERCVAHINRLIRAADRVIFIQHAEDGGLEEGSAGFALLADLEPPQTPSMSPKPPAMRSIKRVLSEY